jgi:signal transduction histidine kinase
MYRPLSVRSYLLGLILVVLIPLLGFSAYLVIRAAQHEQELLAETVRGRTHEFARTFERELATLRTHLFIIANIGTVEGEGFASFYSRAHSDMERHGMAVILSDLSGNELLNTRAPLGATLPPLADPEAIRRVATTREPEVSDLTINPVTNRPAVWLSVPVFEGRDLAYVASMNVFPALTSLLDQLQLPHDWIAAILDQQGRTVARSLDPQRYIGQPGTPDFMKQTSGENVGWKAFVSREGIPVKVAFDRVTPVNWMIVIAIPLKTLYAPLHRSMIDLVMVGVAALLVALSLALLIGRRISRPISGLVNYAAAVGRGELVQLHATGLRETDAVAHSLHDADAELQRSAAELRDSEHRYRTLAANLARANQERQQLLQRTVEAQEAERKHIARELHDSLAQYLTAVRLGLNAIDKSCSVDIAAGAKLKELKCLTTEVGHEISRMARELRPTVLDDLGLQSAITQYLEEWRERSDIKFDLQVHLNGQRLPQPVETTLYRVTQEAIINVVKHAAASHAGIILEATDHQVRLIVEDNGRGFSLPDNGPTGEAVQHFGLIGMRERLALANGTLEIETAPGAGTTLFITVPL